MTASEKLLNSDTSKESMIAQSLLIVCGETSGDEHTAPIVADLKHKNPSIDIFGMGGKNLQKEGMALTVDARETASVMGFTEVIGKLGALIKAFRTILREVDARKNKVALLVDFPDFNLLLAKALHRRGIKVLYFISPQLWAWRSGRITKMKAYVDKIFPIFPFEEEFYKSHHVEATFVGHPFLYRKDRMMDLQEFKNKYLPKEVPENIVALLPGSRTAEVNKIFPVMLEVIKKYKTSNTLFLVPVAHGVSSLFEHYKPLPSNLILVEGHAREILSISKAGVVASGTATVEAALTGLPFCIVYKVSPVTYSIGKLLIKGVSQVGMPNLILKQPLLKELIQDQCTPEILKAELDTLLNDQEYRAHIGAGLERVRKLLTKSDQISYSEIVSNDIISFLVEDAP